jgi:hypothetical protein
MNTTIPFPARYLAVTGVALALAVLFLVARPALLGDSGETVGPSPVPTTPSPTQTPRPTTPTKPRVTLLPGLPPKVANKLRYSKVVVVSLYQGSTAADRSAVAAARAGARSVGAGFLPVNVLNERSARSVQSFVGTTSTPTVVIVRRPGRTVSQLEGASSADEQLVAQAAHNAGAGKR